MIQNIKNKWLGIVLSACAIFALSACASAPQDKVEREAYLEANDPIEPLNRGVFKFNKALDEGFVKPVSTMYHDAVPETVRNAVRNFLNNLRSPLILANNILQGDFDGAKVTIARFTMNTVAGFGGIADPAGDLGAKYRNEDFGQTLAVWGVGEGPYVMLPFLGPSNPRDAIGIVVDSLIDPVGHVIGGVAATTEGTTRTGMQGLELRSRNLKNLEELEKSSLDFYTTVRSLYRQLRTDAIKNGGTQDTIPTPGITFEDDVPQGKLQAQLTR